MKPYFFSKDKNIIMIINKNKISSAAILLGALRVKYVTFVTALEYSSDDIRKSKWNRIKSLVWNFMEKPDSSRYARVGFQFHNTPMGTVNEASGNSHLHIYAFGKITIFRRAKQTVTVYMNVGQFA